MSIYGHFFTDFLKELDSFQYNFVLFSSSGNFFSTSFLSTMSTISSITFAFLEN